ncbi:MAG: hypothetical protein JSW28_08770 [Thermoplasmata archaeon]|nr:MAG: hypothetical protein JSW28_08770 [Thermoplasmata archaeon]
MYKKFESKEQALKLWLKGEAGDEALEEWLTEDGEPENLTKVVLEEEIREENAIIRQKEKELWAIENEINNLRIELGAIKKTLGEKLRKIRTVEIDRPRFLSRTRSMGRQLHNEITKREKLEEHLEFERVIGH